MCCAVYIKRVLIRRDSQLLKTYEVVECVGAEECPLVEDRTEGGIGGREESARIVTIQQCEANGRRIPQRCFARQL